MSETSSDVNARKYACQPQFHFCGVCGSRSSSAPQASVTPNLYDLRHLAPWRCRKCFSEVNSNFLYCPHCGDNVGNLNSIECKAAYRNHYVSCQCALVSDKPQAVTDGLIDLKQALTCYFVCLLPILIFLGLSYHSSEELPIDVEFIITPILYGLILIFAVANWSILKAVFRIPSGIQTFAFIASFAAAPVTIAMAMAQYKFIPGLEAYQENISDDYLIAGYSWTTVYFLIAVCPAVFEEIMYRGIILQRLLRIMSPGQAIVVSSSMFAIMHLNAVGFFFYLVPMALVAGWLTYRSKSIYPAMVLHFLHNATIVFLEQFSYYEF